MVTTARITAHCIHCIVYAMRHQGALHLYLITVLWTQALPSVLWCCWLGGRKGIRPVKKLSGWVGARMAVWSEVQTCIWPSWCHCHSLSIASVKSRLVLPFWYRPIRVVPDTGPLNGCMLYEQYDLKSYDMSDLLPNIRNKQKGVFKIVLMHNYAIMWAKKINSHTTPQRTDTTTHNSKFSNTYTNFNASLAKEQQNKQLWNY